MWRKLCELFKKQTGIALMELIIGIAVTGFVAFGASLATIQVLKQGRATQTGAEAVRDVVQDVRSTITTAAPQNRPIEQTEQPQSRIYLYGIVALNGDITLTGNVTIKSDPETPNEGDIYAAGNINLTGNVTVKGDAVATGNISKTGNVTITGNEVKNLSPALVIASVDTSVYLAEANAGGIYEGSLSYSGNGTATLGPKHITGNLTVSGNRVIQLGGTVWVDGEITMSGNTRVVGPGTLVAVGNIEMTGNLQLLPDDVPLVISTTGSIKVVGNSTTSAILYAPNNNIQLTGNGTVYGSVIGRSISSNGNPKVTYPVSLRQG